MEEGEFYTDRTDIEPPHVPTRVECGILMNDWIREIRRFVSFLNGIILYIRELVFVFFPCLRCHSRIRREGKTLVVQRSERM